MFKKCILVILIFLSVACSNADKELISQTENRISGETITLSGFEENNLLKKNISNLKVYSLDKEKNKVYYEEKVDYVITGNRIKRIKGSNIPNFASHKVIFNNDFSFTFASFPRNPELTIEYQIFCDYNFYDSEIFHGYLNTSYLSAGFKEKLINKEEIKIAVIGTSITAGVHTLSHFYEGSDRDTYAQLVAKAIKIKFGSNVIVENFSKDGSTLGFLEQSYEKILKDDYDLVFIEFGMNDHLYSTWANNISNFELSISDVIKKLKNSNLNVILVGFFQQNTKWDLEFSGSTDAYNQSLFDISKKYNCFFADINKEFSKYSQKKINEDLCGDYMHHPTTFGHQLYYKTIMPVFFDNSVTDGALYKLIN